MADLIYRDVKGSPLSPSEGDFNMRAINSDLGRKPTKVLNGTKVIGYEAADGAAYPVVRRPVEMLSGSAIGFSCSLTAIDEVLESFVIRAGTLGVNSILQIEPVWSFTNSANNKILSVKVGGSAIYSATRTTSATEAPLIVLANRNSVTSQIVPYAGGYVTSGTVAPQTYTIDFSKDQVVLITGQRANSGDSLKLEYYRALHFIGF